MFGPGFNAVLRFELADESRVPEKVHGRVIGSAASGESVQRYVERGHPMSLPEFTGDAQVLATAHQGIRLAAFCRGW